MLKSCSTLLAKKLDLPALRLIFWNAHGCTNIPDLEQLPAALTIGAVETWTLSAPKIPPPWDKYTNHHAPATKDKSVGRPSGGLLFLCCPGPEMTVVESTNAWIFAHVQTPGTSLIVGVVYFKPSYDILVLLDSFQQTLTDIQDKYPHLPVIVGGDFNARVGELNALEPYMLHGTALTANRLSWDASPMKRGTELVNFMEANGFSLLNGRTPGDIPGNFTFTGPQGNSVVDLVWIDHPHLHLANTLTVEHIPTASDHHPVVLELTGTTIAADHQETTHNTRMTRYKWNSSKCSEYQRLIGDNEIAQLDGIGNQTADELNATVLAAIRGASNALGMTVTTTGTTTRHDKPWFDFQCRRAKKDLKNALKNCKATNFEVESKSIYLACKRDYTTLIKNKRSSHQTATRDAFANVKNSIEFWKLYRKLNYKKAPTNPIDVHTWENFFREQYPPRMIGEQTFFGVFDRDLDSYLTLSEVKAALQKTKSGKAPGVDGIGADFYKNLPNEWLHVITSLFNNIIEYEQTPRAWSETLLLLFHKKGDTNDPYNYRGIALCNSLMKVFTQAQQTKLAKWCEKRKIFGEIQNGFRATRSCIDYIFILQSAIHFRLRLGKSRVFALFIDLKRAFDSVSHSLLYQKLYALGLSAKFIRILKCLYDEAFFTAAVGNERTERIEITEGVLQGETLSPLLFLLFISDFESFIREKNIEGLNIDGYNDLLLLLFADDAVALARTPTDMRAILVAVEEYCDRNSLTVNANKTKIVEFKNSGRATNISFCYKNRELEKTNRYTYLGIDFCSSSLGLQAASLAMSKARTAIGASMHLIVNIRADSMEGKLKLFDGVVSPTLLYGSPIWSLRYTDKIEIVQTEYLKRTLSLSRVTNNAALRLEFGIVKLEYKVFKLAWNWIIQLLEMDDERLSKICFKRQLHLYKNTRISPKFNWISQFAAMLEKISFTYVLDNLDPTFWKNQRNAAFDKYFIHLKHLDLIRYNQAPALNFRVTRLLSDQPAEYLFSRQPNAFVKITAQLRLTTKQFVKFTCNNSTYSFDQTALCTMCNLYVCETLLHFLFECLLYAHFRQTYLQFCYVFSPNNPLLAILHFNFLPYSKLTFAYISNSLKLRSFIMRE